MGVVGCGRAAGWIVHGARAVCRGLGGRVDGGELASRHVRGVGAARQAVWSSQGCGRFPVPRPTCRQAVCGRVERIRVLIPACQKSSPVTSHGAQGTSMCREDVAPMQSCTRVLEPRATRTTTRHTQGSNSLGHAGPASPTRPAVAAVGVATRPAPETPARTRSLCPTSTSPPRVLMPFIVAAASRLSSSPGYTELASRRQARAAGPRRGARSRGGSEGLADYFWEPPRQAVAVADAARERGGTARAFVLACVTSL